MVRHPLLLAYRPFQWFRSMVFVNLINLSAGLACTVYTQVKLSRKQGTKVD